MILTDKQSVNFKLTDQGYLVAKASKLARIGAMEYLSEELGLKSGSVVDVHVDSAELFNPKTIQSFENMPVSLEHPTEQEITSSNWRDLAVGHIANIAISDDQQFLIGDIYVNDAKTIKEIQSGTVEVSCGYDADIEDQNGRFSKVNIRGNHLAIVTQGRCGGECKLNFSDRKPKAMAKKLSTFQRLFGKSAQKRKLNDSKSKVLVLRKKLSDAKAEFDAKLKDAEEVLVSEDATIEEKAAVIQELQEEAQALQEESTQALDQVAELAAQIEEDAPTEETVNDDDVVEGAEEAANKIADLEQEIIEKDQEITELKQQIEKLEEAQAQKESFNDAKAVFTKAVFKDSMNSREIKATAIASTGAMSFNDAMKLADCALNSSYAAAKTVLGATSNIGKRILSDRKAPTVSAQKLLGGK